MGKQKYMQMLQASLDTLEKTKRKIKIRDGFPSLIFYIRIFRLIDEGT